MNSYPQPRLFPFWGWKWTLVFIIVALVEIYVLTLVNARIGFGSTVLLILFSGVSGILLMRWEGIRCWNRFLRDVSVKKDPINCIRDGVLILIGGILLILPGVLTDIVGLALFFPPIRILVRFLFLRNVTFENFAASAPTTFDFMASGKGFNFMGQNGERFPFGNFYEAGFSDASGPNYRDSNDFDDENEPNADQDDEDIYDSEYCPHVDSLADPDRPIQIIDVEAKKSDDNP